MPEMVDKIKKDIFYWYSKTFPKYISDLKKVTVNINNRYTSSLATFDFSEVHYSDGTVTRLTNSNKEIVVSGKALTVVLKFNEYDIFFRETIVHELIHLYCFMRGVDFRDGTPYFENMLVKYNSSSSGKTNENKRGTDLSTATEVSCIYTCYCNNRKFEYPNMLRGDMVCNDCEGLLKYKGRYFVSYNH